MLSEAANAGPAFVATQPAGRGDVLTECDVDRRDQVGKSVVNHALCAVHGLLSRLEYRDKRATPMLFACRE